MVGWLGGNINLCSCYQSPVSLDDSQGMQLMAQHPNTQTGMVTHRLDWPRGQFCENYGMYSFDNFGIYDC